MVKVKPKRFPVLLQTPRNVLLGDPSSGKSIVLETLQKLFSARQSRSLFLQSKVKKAGESPKELNLATEH
jgi:predicted ATP-dependent endonuclease of OLD family